MAKSKFMAVNVRNSVERCKIWPSLWLRDAPAKSVLFTQFFWRDHVNQAQMPLALAVLDVHR
jgi:hypothetical protein